MTLAWSVLVSAIVAAMVTLLIEYAAKPSLEVRKERILAARRRLRQLCERLELILEYEREGWFPTRPPEDDDWARDRSEAFAKAGAEGEEVRTLLLRCRPYLPKDVYTLLDYGLSGWKVLLSIPLGPWDQAHLNAQDETRGHFLAGVDTAVEYISLSRWHVLRRRALRAEARKRYSERFGPEPA